GGGGVAGRVVGRDPEEVAGVRRCAPPVVAGRVRAGRADPAVVDAVDGFVDLEAVLGAGVVGPRQIDLAAANGHGRQGARRRRRRRRGHGGGVGGGGVAGRVGGGDVE